MLGAGLAGKASEVAASISKIKSDMAAIEKSLANISKSSKGLGFLGAGSSSGGTHVNPSSGLGVGTPQFTGSGGSGGTPINNAPSFSQQLAGGGIGGKATLTALAAGSFAYGQMPSMQGTYDQRSSAWALNNTYATGTAINYDQQFGKLKAAFGGYATSPNAIHASASYLATKGVLPGSAAFNSIAGQAAGFTSLMPGLSTEQATASLQGLNNPALVNRSMMLGVRTSYGNGTQRNMGYIARDIEMRVFGGRVTQDKLGKSLNNGRLQMQLSSMGFDDTQQQMVIQAMQQHAANPKGQWAIDTKTADARNGDSRSPWTRMNQTQGSEAEKINSYSEAMLAGFDKAMQTAQAINGMLEGLRDVLAPIAAMKGFQGGMAMTSAGAGIQGFAGSFGGSAIGQLVGGMFKGGLPGGGGLMNGAKGLFSKGGSALSGMKTAIADAGGIKGFLTKAGPSIGKGIATGVGRMAGGVGIESVAQMMNQNWGTDAGDAKWKQVLTSLGRTGTDALAGLAVGNAPGAVVGALTGLYSSVSSGFNYGNKNATGNFMSESTLQNMWGGIQSALGNRGAGKSNGPSSQSKTTKNNQALGDGTAAGAVRWAMGQVQHPSINYTNLCDHFVGMAYGRSSSGYPSARAHAASLAKVIRKDGNPPPGALVFWDTGPYGHAALSVGGGKVASTDILRQGKVDIVPISLITSKWGHYTGWAPPTFGGKVVANLGPATDTSLAGGTAATEASGTSTTTTTTISSGDSTLSPALSAASISINPYGGLSASASSAASLVASSVASLMGGSIGLGVAQSDSTTKTTKTTTSSAAGATSASGVASPSAGPSPVGKGQEWLAKFLYHKGLRGNLLSKMWGIAYRESNGTPTSVNRSNHDGSWDWGLFQINDGGKHKGREKYLNADYNYRIMMKMSKNGTNWSDWGMHNSDGSLTGWAKSLGPKAVAGFEANAAGYSKMFPAAAHKAGIPGYSQGAWSLSNDQIANVHKGEMILPASLAEVVRDGVRKSYAGQGGGGGKTVILNVYPQNGGYSEAVQLARTVKQILDEDKMLTTIGGA